jgi:hypothetical protein
MIADKIQPHHLGRKAVLYVRQSSAHQVLHNRESGLLQYAMQTRLTALGWSEVEVIDDDLGRSAAGGIPRAGFERMVAEVITTTPQAMARGWHPAPARQFVIVVRGALVLEVSDGETRQVDAGSMVSLLDFRTMTQGLSVTPVAPLRSF